MVMVAAILINFSAHLNNANSKVAVNFNKNAKSTV